MAEVELTFGKAKLKKIVQQAQTFAEAGSVTQSHWSNAISCDSVFAKSR